MVYAVSLAPRGILDLLTPVGWAGVFLVVVGALKLCSRKVTVIRVFVGFGVIFTTGAIFHLVDSVSVLSGLIFGFSMFAIASFAAMIAALKRWLGIIRTRPSPRLRKTSLLIMLSASLAFFIPFQPVHASTTATWTNTYSGPSENACLLSGGQSTGFTDLQPVFDPIFHTLIVGNYLGDAATASSSCTGYGSLRAFAWAAYWGASVDSTAQLWFIDSITIPNNGQSSSILDFTGNFYLLGWQGAFASGLGSFHSFSQAYVLDKVFRSDGVIVEPGWNEQPQGVSKPECGPSTTLTHWPPGYCDTGGIAVVGQNSFSHEADNLQPGYTYYLIMNFNVTSHADSNGPGITDQASTCFAYYPNPTPPGDNGDCLVSGAPPPTTSCPSGTSPYNGNCFYFQWISTKYTRTDFFSGDPMYSLSTNSPLSYSITSGGSWSFGYVKFGLTLTAYGGWTGTVFVSARSQTGQTAYSFQLQGNNANYSGVSASFSCSNPPCNTNPNVDSGISIWLEASPCSAYKDVITIFANSGSQSDTTTIPVTVANGCAALLSANPTYLSMLSATSSSAVSNIALSNNAISWPQGAQMTASFVNYSYIQNGQTMSAKCNSGTTCPWVAFNATSCGNSCWSGFDPMTKTLPPPGGMYTLPLRTTPRQGTVPGSYLLNVNSAINFTNTINYSDCSASTISWNCTNYTVQKFYGYTWDAYLSVIVGLDFSVSASPSSVSLQQGYGVVTQITVTSLNGFSGSVSLTATPSVSVCGFTALFPNNPYGCNVQGSTTVTVASGGSSSAILNISTCLSTPPGPYTVSVTGTSGGLSHTTTIQVQVLSGPGCDSGSVAAGTLITLANGDKRPVQNLQAGMQLLSYNVVTNQFVTSTITSMEIVHTNDMLVIHTADGQPLVTDNATIQKLWVRQSNGNTGWLSVTQLRVGDYLYRPLEHEWTIVIQIDLIPGSFTMYDIYTTAPRNYVANGYLDPVK